MPGTTHRRARGRTVRLALAVLVLALGAPGLGAAHGTANGFRDDFERPVGPLPGSLLSDPYEIKSGIWRIVDQPAQDASLTEDTNRILVQESKAITPNEPLVFVRAKAFRSFTAQVTAAFMDPTSAFGDLTAGGSVGIAFRAPITNGIADKDNLYLFSAVVTGVAPGFPTGRAFVLFKRVARGYYLLNTKTASTWGDLSKPHEYKVVVTVGHIQAFVDGRLVIDHTDIPSGDTPTLDDPLPGLPFDQGAVGLRTSSARAWFDDFVVVGNDAYEARANALDVYTNYGVDGVNAVPNGQVRRGTALQSSAQTGRLGATVADTGFLYHDHDFDEALVRPIANPSGGSAGAFVGASSSGGVVTSAARLSGISGAFSDAEGRVSVQISASSVEATASAGCAATSSTIQFADASLTVRIKGVDRVPDTTIGPIPLNVSYKPNTVIYERSGIVSIVAHARVTSTEPQRVEIAALKIVLPEGGGVTVPAQQTPPTPAGGGQRTGEARTQNPPLEFSLGQALAGRYCG